jgi:VWFA-related protein
LAIAGVALAVSGPSAAPRQQQPQFRGGVDLVRLDVSVLDAADHPVRGLTADDFTIHDNGRAYTPSFFEAIEVPLALETDASWRSEVASDVTSNEINENARLIVIVLDDSALPMTTTRSKDQAKAIAYSVIDQLAPSDLAAVVFTLNDSTAQSFTSDKGRLRRAVDGLQAGFVGVETGPTEEHFERGSIRTLDFVAEKLIEVPGRRKALVYISGGVPVGSSGTKYLDMLDMFKQAQRANLAVYAFNPFGLGPTRFELPNAGARFEYIRTVATNTGGFAVVEVNDPAESVHRVFEENSSYYLIGYEPVDPPEPGKLRAVDVQVHRPGVRVRTRHGYSTPERERKLTADEQALRDAIGGLLPVSQTPMRVQVAPFPVPGKSEAAVLIAAELRQPPPERVIEQEVRLIITAYDDRGRPRESTEEVLTAFVEPGERETAIEVLSRLDLKPGRYEIRLANRNPDRDLTGSVFQPVEVPDFRRNGVRLSGVVLSRPATTFAGAREPPDDVRAVVPVTPTTRREFARGDRATVFARVYQGGRRDLEDVDVHVTILAADGRPVTDRTGTLAASQFESDRQADLDMELPLPAFEPGEYLLTIAIVGSDDDAATRHVRFRVR